MSILQNLLPKTGCSGYADMRLLNVPIHEGTEKSTDPDVI